MTVEVEEDNEGGKTRRIRSSLTQTVTKGRTNRLHRRLRLNSESLRATAAGNGEIPHMWKMVFVMEGRGVMVKRLICILEFFTVMER